MSPLMCQRHEALLQDGPATFDAMIAAIDGATTRVDFEGYIFRDDEVGRRFRDALIDAAMRGVQVRVLVDWVGRMGTPRAFFREMTRFGVQVQLFSPPGFRAWGGILPRDHRKLVVADGAIAVTGGSHRRSGSVALRRERAVARHGGAHRRPRGGRHGRPFERMWARTRGALGGSA
jgi:cardiolipin synthase